MFFLRFVGRRLGFEFRMETCAAARQLSNLSKAPIECMLTCCMRFTSVRWAKTKLAVDLPVGSLKSHHYEQLEAKLLSQHISAFLACALFGTPSPLENALQKFHKCTDEALMQNLYRSANILSSFTS